MKNIFWLLSFMLLMSACMDKPTGESDDVAVELNELTFDRLYATRETGSGKLLMSDTKSAWNGNVFLENNDLILSLNMPKDFVIPYDPDAPDTLPAKVKTIELFIMIADENGNSILEQRSSGDLTKDNHFRYELPDMAFRNVPKGPHTFRCNAAFKLVGSQGSTVGPTLANWNFKYERDIPPIYKTAISFSEFRLSDALYEKSKSNNDGLGNPLPDLFWTFKSEGLENFKSSTFENSNPYFVEKLTFNFYHLKKDAPVWIEVWDDDYTSLNDKLAEWKGNLSKLIADKDITLAVKGLDFFKLHAAGTQISNP